MVKAASPLAARAVVDSGPHAGDEREDEHAHLAKRRGGRAGGGPRHVEEVGAALSHARDRGRAVWSQTVYMYVCHISRAVCGMLLLDENSNNEERLCSDVKTHARGRYEHETV